MEDPSSNDFHSPAGLTHLSPELSDLPDLTLTPSHMLLEPTDTSWISALWVIPNNALRYDLAYMYRTLDALLKDKKVSEWRINLFYKWYDSFKMYLHEVKDAEERVLRPWIEDVLKENMPQKYKDDDVYLLLQTNQISNIKLKMGHVENAEVVQDLAKTLKDLGIAIVKQANRRENEVAPLLEQCYANEDKDKDKDKDKSDQDDINNPTASSSLANYKRKDIEKAYYKTMLKVDHWKELLEISCDWMDKKTKKKVRENLIPHLTKKDVMLQNMKDLGELGLKKTQHRKILDPILKNTDQHHDSSSSEDEDDSSRPSGIVSPKRSKAKKKDSKLEKEKEKEKKDEKDKEKHVKEKKEKKEKDKYAK